MQQIHKQKMTARIDGDFVIIILGLRINKPWKLHKWLPAFLAMPRMIKELYAHPESGFLGHTMAGLIVIQYWRSFEHLEAYARSKNHEHWPAWAWFNKQVRHGSGDIGIWHETYRVAAGSYEAVYSGMPAIGLGKVGALVPATGRYQSARGRMGADADRAAEPLAG